MCDELLSSFALNSNLRPYNTAFHLSTRIVKPMTLKSVQGMGLHSFTFWLNVTQNSSGIRCVASICH
jgi:hypothetical protein